jgi:hypothetical protein
MVMMQGSLAAAPVAAAGIVIVVVIIMDIIVCVSVPEKGAYPSIYRGQVQIEGARDRRCSDRVCMLYR